MGKTSSWGSQQVTALRRRLGLTQVELAAVLRVHPSTVAKWETKQSKPPATATALLDLLSAELVTPAMLLRKG